MNVSVTRRACVLAIGTQAATAATCPTGWSANGAGTLCSIALSKAGVSTVAVPAGVTQLSAKVWGANGGSWDHGACNGVTGGIGGGVIGTFTVTGGEQLNAHQAGRPRGSGTATLKLLDISTCTDQCSTEPIPYPLGYAQYKLFLLFSEVNRSHARYEFPVGQYTFNAAKKVGETPITFNPQYWLPEQCTKYGCGPQVMH